MRHLRLKADKKFLSTLKGSLSYPLEYNTLASQRCGLSRSRAVAQLTLAEQSNYTMKIYKSIFDQIVSLEGLFNAWEGFKRGKAKKRDVMEFEMKLETNLFELNKELAQKKYKHGQYTSFYITDPKQRHIHKAPVRDRIVHHLLFSILNPIFEPTFIFTSYSCRNEKGTHKGIDKLEAMLRKASHNNTKPCYLLKCDIKKFFLSVNHEILLGIVDRKIKDRDAMSLISEIVGSSPQGLPIGNLTSQLFANVYLSELDHYIKQGLKVPFYVRYTDDFVLVSSSIDELKGWLEKIGLFLKEKLKLELHPSKVILRKYHQGIDFLGYVQYPDYRRLRTKTRRRILNKLGEGITEQALQSYLGVLSHSNSYKLSEDIKNQYWFTKK